MEWILFTIGIAAGLILGALLMMVRSGRQKAGHQSIIHELEKERTVLDDRLRSRINEIERLNEEVHNLRTDRDHLSNRLSRAEVEYKNLQEKLDTQKREMEKLQEKFTLEFENVANRILRHNSQEFTDLNKKNIGDLLNPLKEKIGDFEKKVQETYVSGMKDRTELKTQLQQLKELNQQISEEASHLTKALKADTKKMGNWGEFILDRVLEQSGLVKGQEYVTQHTDRNEDGSIIRPDVIVKLPDNKHLIIDSKVSLLAYDGYVNEDEEDQKVKFLKSHIDSIKAHVKGLAEKNYASASRLDSPDFVLLFMPLESAFSLAMQNDPDLFNYAWERKIVIISPTTLLATLKTVASIWKHEKQTQNAMEIARQGGNLYDKFVSFLEDMSRIGEQINRLQATYIEAEKKLSTGKGNLVRRAEQLRVLGVKADKSLPPKYENEEE
jgi:DNA recombination protein RmuC